VSASQASRLRTPGREFQLDEEERAKVQEIANYIRGKLNTEQKVSLNELGKRFPMRLIHPQYSRCQAERLRQDPDRHRRC
jgi:hypothetical protein